MSNETVYVSMLGNCVISYNNNSIDSANVHSKKIWSLLQYLIFFRGRDIPVDVLTTLIYSEKDSTHPANALKTLIHRCRGALDTLGNTIGKSLLIQKNGSYQWNSSVPLRLDTDQFDELYNKYLSLPPTNSSRFTVCMEAIDLYKGDFLSSSDTEPWIIPIREYYRSRYLYLVNEALETLKAKRSYEYAASLCRLALKIDPYNESLYLNLLQAMLKLGQTQEALIQYEATTKLFYSSFGITPSRELKALYRDIIKSSRSFEMDIEIIKEQLREPSEMQGAFFCEFEFFKDIYRIEVRSAARTGKPVHICLLTFTDHDGRQLASTTANVLVERLIISVEQNLRRGDVFTRYSICQLILLLPLTTTENANHVAERIVKTFYCDNPRSAGVLTYSLQPIDTVI